MEDRPSNRLGRRQARFDPRTPIATIAGARMLVLAIVTEARTQIRRVPRPSAGAVAAFVAATFTLGVFWFAARAQDDSMPATTLEVADGEGYGHYLTDAHGNAVYLFVEESEGESTTDAADDDERVTSGTRDSSPACTAACAAIWSPLSAAKVTAPEGIDADLLYTATVSGRTQVVLNGWPLYTFAGDTQPGDTNGEGIEPPDAAAYGGSWYLVSPDGTPVEEEQDTTPTQAPKYKGGHGHY